MWGDSIAVIPALNLKVLAPQRTVYEGAGLGITSDQVATRAMSNAATRDHIAVIWCGHANFALSIRTPERVVGDIRNLVAQLAPYNGNRFIVVSMHNMANPCSSVYSCRPSPVPLPRGRRGGPDYAPVLEINAQLQAAFPNNYLDTRNWFIANYNPNDPQDVIDYNDDVIPWTFRQDEIHLRQVGTLRAATMIMEFIAAKGW